MEIFTFSQESGMSLGILKFLGLGFIRPRKSLAKKFACSMLLCSLRYAWCQRKKKQEKKPALKSI